MPMDDPLPWQLLDSVCFLVLPRLFPLTAAELFLWVWSAMARSAPTKTEPSERYFWGHFDFEPADFEPARFASA